MKKKLQILFLPLLLLTSQSYSQLPNGSVAPNFTLNDINGNSHTLYDYLDAGKTVYIDFFACHCPYCWNYHSTNALTNLFNVYGPGTTPDDIFVFAIELDANNGNNEFYGISGNTQGDWVAGTNYPQINPEGADRTTIISDFAANYYPLIYAICPDRTITVIGTKTTNQLYAHTETCEELGLTNQPESEFQLALQDSAIHLLSSVELQNATIQLIDIQGKIIKSEAVTSTDSKIGINGVSSGLYFVQLVQNHQIIYSQKIQF